MLKKNGRYIVAFLSLLIAFVLSIKFGDRGVEFNVKDTTVSASETKVPRKSNLKILSKVILHLKENYVDKSRIDPAKMMVYGLDEIQNSIPEVVVHFNKDKDLKPTEVTVYANEKKKAFNIGNINSIWEMKLRFSEIFSFIQEHLEDVPGIKFNEVEYAAINGMLSTLDPHSNLLPPQNYEEMQTQTGGKFGGLGIVISIRDGELTVISPIDGTPASRKGIKSRDRIVRIGDVSTINMNLNEAVGMMRGKVGTPIDLWIMRKGWSEARKYTIVRAEIKIKSVDFQLLGDKIGYIRIKNFQANTAPDMKTHLRQLKEKMGGLEGLVLDLRDNPGGLLDQAIKVSDLFLDKGVIVSTVGVGNRLREKRHAKPYATEPFYPIIVLLSPGSASASEIVAGALQNHDRALVLGERSFGKGSVQMLYNFPDDGSALKLTIAQYLTPGGISIQGRGILPDIRVLPVEIGKKNIDIFPSTRTIREGDLGQHLTNDASNSKKSNMPFIQYFEKPDKNKKDGYDNDKFKEDFQIRLAQRLLKKTGDVYERPKFLAELTDELEKVSDIEYKIIKKQIKKLRVDWSRGTPVEHAKLSVLTKISDDGVINAGEKLNLVVTAKNEGQETLYQVKAITKADASFLDDRELLFGKIAPGESRTWTLEVEIPKDVSSRFDFVNLRFSDSKFEWKNVKAVADININAVDRPRFAFTMDVKDASGDGKLAVGESVKLEIEVQNFGQKDSAETFVYLRNLAGKSIYLKKGRQKLKTVKKGTSEKVVFEFDIKEPPKDGNEIEMEIDIYDTTFREYTEKKFKLSLGSGKNTNVKKHQFFQPPSVKMKAEKQITTDDHIKVFGSANDNSEVRDYYVFVYNRAPAKIKTKKLLYSRGGGKKTEITLDVPLFKGMNRIAVIVRDDDHMASTQMVYVYRK